MKMEESLLIPRPEHPEPQLRRESWLNLNGEWLFENDTGSSGKERGLMLTDSDCKYTKKITVPFCPESALSGLGIKDFMSSVWYKRTFELKAQQLGGRVLLHFGAVDYECDVYINGRLAASHFGGYSSFCADITDFAVIGCNDITVNARDNLRSSRQPAGKQSQKYSSFGCFYTRTTGIWQTVWLEFVPSGYIKSAKYYPDINGCAFDIDLTLSAPGEVTVKAFFDGKNVGEVCKNAYGNTLRLHLPLTEKQLWEVGKGRLYNLEFTLKSGNTEDRLISYAGLREIKISGFKVLINGKSVFQRTVLDQGFYPDGIYTAPTDEALKKDIELSQALGFNGARLHEKIFEPRFLYYCDKAGYLVWGEHANWGLDISDEKALSAFMPEWLEALERDFNHPSIIGWCPFNETWGTTKEQQKIIMSVYKATKQFDPTRPVIDTSGGHHVATDIFDQHDYEQNPDIFRKSYENYNGEKGSFSLFHENDQVYTPGLPFFLSEFGGFKWVVKTDETEENGAWGYGNAVKTEDEFFARYEGLTAALLENPNIMGFCYTQLYDVEQEQNGLYSYNRKPKFKDYSRIIAANKATSAIE